MQKKSQKLQSLQDKQRNHLENACACEEVVQIHSEEMEERKAMFETHIWLYRRSQATVGRQQMTWKWRSRPCRQERKQEAAVRHIPMDAAVIQPCRSIFSRSEQLRLCSSSPVFIEKSPEYLAGNIRQS